MRRVFLSWPVKAVSLAVSAVWVVSVAHAAPESELIQLEADGGWRMGYVSSGHHTCSPEAQG